MSSRDAKTALEGLQRLSRTKPHPNDLWISILNAADSILLESRSPIGALKAFHIQAARIKPIPDASFALLTSVAVEQALELAISTHFKIDADATERMFDDNSNGPLGTFAAKIKMAYALGIYPKVVRDELNMIRTIRNAFAHSWEQIDFSTQEIVDGCAQLKLPNNPNLVHASTPPTAKDRFIASVQQLYVYLEWDSVAYTKLPMLYETHPGRNVFSGL